MDKNPLDRENIGADKSICDKFEKGEKVLLSSLVQKYNHVNKKQERILCITDKAVYNISPSKFLSKLISKVVQVRIKRRIPFNKIHAVTISRFGSQFIIHVPDEHDYLLQSDDFRQKIIEVLCYSYCTLLQRKMAFFYKDDIVLMPFCTTKIDAKKKRSNLPTCQPDMVDPETMNDNENAKGKSDLVFNRSDQNTKLSINDFHLIKVLGRGAFGKVMLCQKKDTQELFAIKSIRKEDIIEREQIEHTKTERKILEQVNFPFLVNLEYAFQTKEKLFFAMKFVRGGELFFHLKNDKKFKEQRALFYASQILLALEYLHNQDIIYRDLKPENILLDQDGYVKITDFGLAKVLEKGKLTYSLVGTPDYLSPEIINQKGHSRTADYWAFGILIYEMVIGIPPFFNNNQNVMFQQISEKDVKFPTSTPLSKECMDIILRLLKKDPNERLGSVNGTKDIKEHPWFAKINFDDILNKKVPAPFVPQLKNDTDVSYFDEEFISENPIDSFVQPSNLKNYNDQFNGMSFVPGMQEVGNN
ncbi:hypothetical protein ABPG74_001007 [Tetrahymena malaccensis]